MADEEKRTTDLDFTSLTDSFVVNRGADTYRSTVDAVATQLLAGGPIAIENDARKSALERHDERLTVVEMAQTVNQIYAASWGELAGVAGSISRQGAEVPETDTGTHTDPVVGGTVPNSGRFSWSASPVGWRRIGATAYTSVSARVATVEAKTNILWGNFSNIASAATTDVGATTTDFLNVTGGVAISALGTAANGVERVLRFNQALTITHNATSLILPGAADIAVQAGDIARFRSVGSGNWRCVGYLRASGKALTNPTKADVGMTDVYAALTNIASAATTDIGAVLSDFLNVTGTTAITSLGTAAAGVHRVLRLNTILTLTHDDTSLILPGAANIVTAGGDVAQFRSLGSGNWRCVGYLRASGKPVVLPAKADVGLGNADNTSDAAKPVSTAQAAAIAASSANTASNVSDDNSASSLNMSAIVGILMRAGITISEADRAALLAPAPIIGLDFAGGASLSVTRSVAASRINKARLFDTSPANVSRYAHDPLTGERVGLLVEGSGGNVWTNSDDVSAGAWTKGGCSVVQNTGVVKDPEGANTGARWTEDGSTGNHQIFRTLNFTALAATTTFVEYRLYKPGERTRVLMTGYGAQAVFDLTTGEVVAAFTTGTAYSVRLRNGWVLCAVKFTQAAGATSYTVYERMVTTGQTASYAGDGSSGLYRWHADGGIRNEVRMPVKTTSAAVTADADMATIDVGGWWTAGRASLVIEARAAIGGGRMIVAQIDDGTAANRILVQRDASGNGNITVTAGGSEVANVDLGVWADGTDRRIGVAWYSGAVHYSVNGAAAVTIALAGTPTGLSSLRLGLDETGAGSACIIRLLEGHARIVTDAELANRTLRRSDRRVSVWGDSIAAGNATGVTAGYSVPSILGRSMSRQVFNGGVGGQTSDQIKTRLLADNDRRNWLTVIIAGRNDGNAQSTILANIAAMVAALPFGARFLILSVPYAANADVSEIAYVTAINSALASAYGARFVAIDWSTISRVADQLHPDDAGNAVVSAAIAAKVASFGW